ncbi:membrane protein [Actinotalea ferrariae CF5-4]|uniref:Membrane protein n=1 Tax=Actinotalea ferrariae CF5-4 TaxID=948458 RepID=A0A021VXG5_9CELL|nr:hypothetical protein [Actinotalea ferrariae]EYR64725.1 membrane protein [Actinotalea ferrariae CF5-4]
MSAPQADTGGRTASGPGRALVAVYGVLAVAATFRSGVQVLRDFGAAPVAYSLSAFAAVVYVVATLALARAGGRARRVAWVAVGIEAVGVLVVGTLSVVRPDLFPDATVWSAFGAGYGFVPLVLPALGLWWLARGRGGRPAPAERPDR